MVALLGWDSPWHSCRRTGNRAAGNLPSVDGRTFGDQPIDFGRSEPGLPQDLDAVLTQAGRRAADRQARSAPAAGDPRQPQPSLGGMIDLLEEAGRSQMWIVDEVVELAQPHARDVVRLQQIEPLARGARLEDLRQRAVSLLVVPRPFRIG